MAGTPDPVLGSEVATVAVSVAVAGFVAALPLVYRENLPASLRLALLGGAGYALLPLGVWAGARLVTDAFVVVPGEQPLAFLGVVAVGTLVFGIQGAVSLYLYARWRLATAVVGLFVTTAVALYAFLQVRGESDPLVLYELFFGPLLIGLVVLAAAIELGIRRVLAHWY